MAVDLGSGEVWMFKDREVAPVSNTIIFRLIVLYNC